MMEVGRVNGSLAWNRAHFGAWCVVSAPLVLGLDLSDRDALAAIVPVVANPEAIAINQQWSGHPGRLVAEFFVAGDGALPVQLWAKPQPEVDAGSLDVWEVKAVIAALGEGDAGSQ